MSSFPAAFLLVVLALPVLGGGSQGAPSARPSCVSSPHGNVTPPDAPFYSADGRFYARQLAPFSTGQVGVYTVAKDGPVARLQLVERGPLKGGCIARDGSWVALVYHRDDIAGQKGYVAVLSTRTARETRRIPIPAYYHNFSLSDDGREIVADGQRLPVGQ
jgi:hypothetical protein